MRGERPQMVQTLAQYIFIYEAIFEEMHAGYTYMGENLRDYYQELAQRNPVTGRSYLHDQFLLLQTLVSMDKKLSENVTTTNVRNISSVPDLIPAKLYSYNYTHNTNANSNLDVWGEREDNQAKDDLLGCCFNAAFVDSHRTRNHFIVAETPIPSTVADFWQLVYDNEVRSIVMMEDADPVMVGFAVLLNNC